ncbi:MAG: YfhO family protein [Anaerorhabdus sp.]
MKKRDYLILVGIVVAMLLVIFSPILLANRPLTVGTDLKPQYLFFTKELYNLWSNFFETGTLPFYSWVMFLGTNFYSSMTFYGSTDIFNLIGYIFRSYNFFDVQMYLLMFKVLVAVIGMAIYLNKFKYSKYIIYIGSIAFGLSSWMFLFSGHPMFFSFYCLTPFYFLGIEKYLKENKVLLYALMCILLLLTNWYFFFSISMISPLYFIYRYYMINGNFNNFIKRCLKLILIYIVAVGCTMVSTYPTLLYMRESERAGFYLSKLFFTQKWKIYLHQLFATFVPSQLYIYGNNIFETGWHVTRELALWAGSVVSISIVSMLFAFKKESLDKYKKATIIFHVILYVMLALKIFNGAIHGFSDPSFRWSMFIIFFNISTMAYVLSNLKSFSLKKISWCAFGVVLLCFIGIPMTSKILNVELLSYQLQWTIFLKSMIFIALTSFILVRNKENFLKILLIITVVEFTFFGWNYYSVKLNRGYSGTYEFHKRAVSVIEKKEEQLNNYLDYLDPNNLNLYYRLYVSKSLTWNYSHNIAMTYGYHGLSVYASTITPSIYKLSKMAPQIISYNSQMIFDIEDKDLMNYLSVKYAMVTNEDELIDGINWKLIDDAYFESIRVYENMDYQPFITGVNKVIKQSEFKDLKQFYDGIVVEDDLYEYLKDKVNDSYVDLYNVNTNGNSVFANVHLKEDGIIQIKLPYDKGWKITLNGKLQDVYRVNGGFMAVEAPKGDVNIQMYFTPDGFKTGAIISFISIFAFGIYFIKVFYDKRKKLEL